jgi:hypothetical protein
VLNFDALTIPMKEVEKSEKHQWREGHSLKWNEHARHGDCEVCYEASAGGMFICDGISFRSCINGDCRLTVHHRCLDAVTLPCMSAANFSPDRIRAAFLRCFASLLYNYRKHFEPVSNGRRYDSGGKLFDFKMQGFLRSAPRDMFQYIEMLSETQAFNEFIMERCEKSPDDPEIALFDQIIVAKRNRGRHGVFSKQGILPSFRAYKVTPMLSKPLVNLETKTTVPPNESKLPSSWHPPDNPPAKLDPLLLLPPRLAQPPRAKFNRDRIRRKPVNRSDETIKAVPKTETV